MSGRGVVASVAYARKRVWQLRKIRTGNLFCGCVLVPIKFLIVLIYICCIKDCRLNKGELPKFWKFVHVTILSKSNTPLDLRITFCPVLNFCLLIGRRPICSSPCNSNFGTISNDTSQFIFSLS